MAVWCLSLNIAVIITPWYLHFYDNLLMVAHLDLFYSEMVEDIAPSVIPSQKTLNVETSEAAENDISDIENEGYCDDTSDSNKLMSMRLQVVKKDTIKQLYRNTEKVDIYICKLNVVCIGMN